MEFVMFKIKFPENFRFCTSMMLLLTGSLGAVVVAAPAGAFSFGQSGYSANFLTSSPSAPPGSITSLQGSASLSGSFEGSDLDGDGKLICLSSIGAGGCEITSFSSQIIGNITITQSPVPSIGYPGNTQFLSFNSNQFFPPPDLRLSYTIGDSNSLVFEKGFNSGQNFFISAGNNTGRYVFGQFSGSVSNSPLLVSGDSTPIPEPSTISGLLLAGGVGAWLKRISLRRLTARQVLPEKLALNCR
jgi:hypothetical protein